MEGRLLFLLLVDSLNWTVWVGGAIFTVSSKTNVVFIGANVHATTATGDTALTYACENGHTDVADVLLQAGADLVRLLICILPINYFDCKLHLYCSKRLVNINAVCLI